MDTTSIYGTIELPSVFKAEHVADLIKRIEQLQASSTPKWGKMNAAQMLAHCNVTYEMAYEDIHKKPGFVKRFFLKKFVKPIVVSGKPYPPNSRTAPEFIVASERDFQAEKQRLIDYLNKTQSLGSGHFEGRESLSFGQLTSMEWNNMFYKHLDHHLRQFGV